MNNSSDPNWSLVSACMVTQFVLHQSHLVPLSLVEIFLGIGAVLLNVCVIGAIWKVKAFHSHLRCLLIYFSLCLAWFSLSRVYKAFYILDLLREPFPCDSLKTAYRCGLDELWISLPSYIAPWSFFGVCLERLYATIQYKTYETSSTSPWMIMAIVVAISITPIASNINTILVSPKTTYTPLCEGLLSAARALGFGSASLWVGIAAMVICLASAVCCKYWNDYKMRMGALNRAQQTLASRFQIAQNVQINRMLLPTMILQTVCHAPHYIVLLLLLSGSDLSVGTRFILTNCNYIWRLAYALLHPLLSFYCIRALRQQLESLPCVQRKSKVAPNQVTEAKLHFAILQAAWDSARP